jgi:hypothetical protein
LTLQGWACIPQGASWTLQPQNFFTILQVSRLVKIVFD